MLFHYGFYSNKHPSVPACSHARSVEAGEHHLSRVKFPTVADQSKLNILELFLRSLRLGLAATRANLTTPDPPARNIGSRRNEPRRFALAEGGKKGVFFG